MWVYHVLRFNIPVYFLYHLLRECYFPLWQGTVILKCTKTFCLELRESLIFVHLNIFDGTIKVRSHCDGSDNLLYLPLPSQCEHYYLLP